MNTDVTIPTIICDSREQHSYTWEPTRDGIASVSCKLDAGDYSIHGAEDLIAIERKSTNDWVSTITHSRDRFIKELQKLQALDRAYIVIECSANDILMGRYDRARTNPPAVVMQRTIGLMNTWGIPVIFGGDRIAAREMVGDLLVNYLKYRAPMVRALAQGGEING